MQVYIQGSSTLESSNEKSTLKYCLPTVITKYLNLFTGYVSTSRIIDVCIYSLELEYKKATIYPAYR